MDYDDKKLLAHMLFNKLGEEGVESLAVDTNFYSHEVWNSKRPGTYMPTPEEIAKLPQWEYVSMRRDMFRKLRFGNDWHMEIFQENGKAILAIGENYNMHHKDIQDMYENEGIEGWDINDFVRKLGQYDHVFPLVLGRGFLLQGSEQNLLAACNRGDDPLVVAQNVIDEYDLEESNLEFIARVVEVHLGVFDLPIPILTLDDTPEEFWNEELIIALLFALLYMCIAYVFYKCFSMIPRHEKKKTTRKPAPRKSPLSCHQPKMKKTVYVKLFASKNLNGKQGRRLNGIISKSGVQYIEFERKTGQPTVMYKIKASNGVVYVPVHIKGSEGAVQKAVVLIQEAIGTENVDEKIELPPTKPQPSTTSPKRKSTLTRKISSSAPPKIPKKKKSTSRSLSSTIWSSVCVTCQSLRTITINSYQNATSNIRNVFNGTIISIGDFMYYLSVALIPFHVYFSRRELAISCYYIQQKAAQIVRLCSQPSIVPNYTNFTPNTDQSKTEDAYWITLFLVFAMLGWFCALSYEYVSCLKIKQTIYVKSTKAKELKVQQQQKMQEIVNKSDLDEALIDSTAVVDNYVPIHMSGSKRSVWKAIELIREAVGTEHVSITKPSNTVSVQESTSSTVNGSDSQPNQEVPSTPESPVQREIINNSGDNRVKETTAVQALPSNVVQEEEEEEEEEEKEEEEEEEVPSEIGIDSTQGMTRETIIEASISSLNDKSSISKAYSSFTFDENDPLLIFLRSQASCIKGSVDEFYTWLVKSEDIDSMMALKEAVSEDDYLNDMKVGDGEGSGIKGFKRKTFLRAISEYFDDKLDTKSTAEVHQSLPQCQRKNLSETSEPPEELVCPISLVLMTNEPVLAADGITYERSSIEDWFEKSKANISKAQENLKQNPKSEADQRVVNNGVCSPILGTKMENLTLMPHIGTRNMARSFEEKQKQISPIVEGDGP